MLSDLSDEKGLLVATSWMGGGGFSQGEHPHVPRCPRGPHTVWRCLSSLKWVTGSGPTGSQAGNLVPAGAPGLGTKSFCSTPYLMALLVLQGGQLEEVGEGNMGRGRCHSWRYMDHGQDRERQMPQAGL